MNRSVQNRNISNTSSQKTEPTQARGYQIRIEGHLGADWADWFGGLTLTLDENGETLLTAPALDQAALHGLLKKVRDLGLTLVSVNQVNHSEKE
jgi:hypothetical protein